MREECSQLLVRARETEAVARNWTLLLRAGGGGGSRDRGPTTHARTLAPSVDALVDGASTREPMESADSKSGARFERVVIDGDAFVVKHVDRAYDWIARQTGDLACWPIVVWERGLDRSRARRASTTRSSAPPGPRPAARS